MMRIQVHKIVVAGAIAAAMTISGAVPVMASHMGSQSLPLGITLPVQPDAESELFDLMNAARVGIGLAPLVRVPSLDVYARQWSGFMAGGGCILRDATSLCHRQNLAIVVSVASPKGWTRAGENIGSVPDGGTVTALHEAFMNSAAHRANILQSTYNAVGVGVEFDPNGKLFVTFEFVTMIGDPNSTGPIVGFPDPPAGSSQQEAFLFYVNFLRQQAGLAPLVRQVVLDRESEFWNVQRQNGACGEDSDNCNRRDMTDVVRAAVGAGKTRWWGGAVGATYASDPSAQVSWFMATRPLKNMFMRKDANMIGIGISTDIDGLNFISVAVVTVKNPMKTMSGNVNNCGWVQANLRVRSKGAAVRVAQCALAGKGFWDGPVDGYYSTTFAAAVKNFQRSRSLKPTGVFDVKTRRALKVV